MTSPKKIGEESERKVKILLMQKVHDMTNLPLNSMKAIFSFANFLNCSIQSDCCQGKVRSYKATA